jgi:hypothetical protein
MTFQDKPNQTAKKGHNMLYSDGVYNQVCKTDSRINFFRIIKLEFINCYQFLSFYIFK